MKMVDSVSNVKPASNSLESLGGTELQRLQRALLKLMENLEDLSKDRSPEAKERLKAPQLQIQNTEQRIQQLQSDKTEKERNKHRHGDVQDVTTLLSGPSVVTSIVAASDIGTFIDTHA
jgi:chromosome segregation ATPase